MRFPRPAPADSCFGGLSHSRRGHMRNIGLSPSWLSEPPWLFLNCHEGRLHSWRTGKAPWRFPARYRSCRLPSDNEFHAQESTVQHNSWPLACLCQVAKGLWWLRYLLCLALKAQSSLGMPDGQSYHRTNHHRQKREPGVSHSVHNSLEWSSSGSWCWRIHPRQPLH